ncbi:unnamed protein product [Echinostoma caproni]|uniref:C2H2-type domain-containing protein n=1 Tax=Echinostoma caproni TaxID=27848 RepID=A0A183AQ89_9TREM|nr:unnamed protein product [Echinostoma caproni]
MTPESEPVTDADADHSPQPLIIVDEVDSTGPRSSNIEIGPDSKKNVLFRPHMMDAHDSSELHQSGLVFKLKKCTYCTFHSIDEREYQQHVQTHRQLASTATANTDFSSTVLNGTSSNGSTRQTT